MTKSHRDASLLLTALGANALFSFGSAIALFIAGSWIAAQLGLPPEASLDTVAVLLGLFALQLATIVLFKRLYVLEIALIIAADILWVLGSGIGLIMFSGDMSGTGKWLVAGVALAVLGFAEAQGLGLKRWHNSRSA